MKRNGEPGRRDFLSVPLVCALTTLETRLSTSCNGLGSEVQTKGNWGANPHGGKACSELGERKTGIATILVRPAQPFTRCPSTHCPSEFPLPCPSLRASSPPSGLHSASASLPTLTSYDNFWGSPSFLFPLSPCLTGALTSVAKTGGGGTGIFGIKGVKTKAYRTSQQARGCERMTRMAHHWKLLGNEIIQR